MSHVRVVSPIFFLDHYWENVIQQFIALLDITECHSWFQLDNTLSHVAKETLDFLHPKGDS